MVSGEWDGAESYWFRPTAYSFFRAACSVQRAGESGAGSRERERWLRVVKSLKRQRRAAASAVVLAMGLTACIRAPAGDIDHVVTDPVLIDRQHPPRMVEGALDSRGSQLNFLMYLAQGQGPHPTVVLLHGYPGNEKNLDLAQALRRAGINVLFFNYRGSWGSQGNYSVSNSLQDVHSALAFLRTDEAITELRVDAERIAVIGHSFGGFMALIVAADDEAIECVVSIAGYNLGAAGKEARASTEFAAAFAVGLDGGTGPLRGTSGRVLVEEVMAHAEAWDLLAHVPSLAQRHLLLVAGSRDQVATLADNHSPLVSTLRESGARHLSEVVLDADHSFAGQRIALARAVIAWFSESCGY